MDKSKLNPLVVKMANDLQSAKPSMGLGLACSAVHFKMANIASQLRIRVDTEAGFGTAVANFYGLSFSPSGSGKSVGVNLLDNMYFSEALDYMKKEVFPKFEKKALRKLEEEGIERTFHAWTPKISNATLSGLYAVSETYYLCGVGGINVQLDEVADAVVSKADLFDILLECYNNGDFPAQAKRSDSNAMDIDGIPVNLYAFGDPTKLVNGDNVEFAFQNLLKTGYGRRFIFSNDKTVQTKEKTPEDIVTEMKATEQIKKDRAIDREKIKSLISLGNMNKVLKLSNKAMLLYATIQCEGENYVKENKGLAEAVMSDRLNRVFKTVKLAAIYAFFEEKDTIELEHMQQAFEIIKESSRVLVEITTLKPIHQRLLERMIEEPNPITSSHMLSYPFINKGWTKKILEYVVLAKELASERGLLFKTTCRSGVDYYEICTPTEEESKELDEIDKLDRDLSHSELMDLLS